MTANMQAKEALTAQYLQIKNAVADKELKGDMSKLQAALDKALKDSENYTARHGVYTATQ